MRIVRKFVQRLPESALLSSVATNLIRHDRNSSSASGGVNALGKYLLIARAVSAGISVSFPGTEITPVASEFGKVVLQHSSRSAPSIRSSPDVCRTHRIARSDS